MFSLKWLIQAGLLGVDSRKSLLRNYVSKRRGRGVNLQALSFCSGPWSEKLSLEYLFVWSLVVGNR